MAGGKQRPFGDSLEIERGGDEAIGRSLPKIGRQDGVDALSEEVFDRAETLPLRKQAVLMAAGGGVGTLLLWGTKFATHETLEQLQEQDWLRVAVFACSALAAYGVLQLLFEKSTTAMPLESGGRFGGYVQAGQEEGRWKRRLVSIALGLIATWVYFFV